MLSLADSEIKFIGVLQPFYPNEIVLKSGYTEWDKRKEQSIEHLFHNIDTQFRISRYIFEITMQCLKILFFLYNKLNF